MTTITVDDPLTIIIQKGDEAVAAANDLTLLEAANFLKRPLQEDESWMIYAEKNGVTVFLEYQEVITLLVNHHTHTTISDTERFAMIAICLADSILPMLAGLNETQRFTYPGLISIVAGWALEFHQQYPTIIERWDQFQTTALNKFGSHEWEGFVFEWGKAKLAEAARRYGFNHGS